MQTEEIIRTDEAEQTSEPCNPRKIAHECPLEAVWLLTGMCCGTKTYLCNAHNDSNNKFIDTVARLNMLATCSKCGAQYRGVEVYAAEMVTPLK